MYITTETKMTATGAQAQATMPFNIQDPYWSEVHPGMPCRIKHRLILVRHGESESNIELTTTGQTTEFTSIPLEVGGRGDTPLTALGQEQAQDVADFLELKGIKYDDGHVDRVHISPLWRAIQTALPTLKKVSYCDHIRDHYVDINYDLREKYSKEAYWIKTPELNYAFPRSRRINLNKVRCRGGTRIGEPWRDHHWLREPETQLKFCERVASVMEDWKKEGTVEERKQTIVFTHSQFISQLLAGDSKMFFHLANGSISIIDIDEKNNLHVQVANYTKHLRTPTGMHTCIF
jgi:broad specificity phosphatase PhoE